jgi:hypothetical protein
MNMASIVILAMTAVLIAVGAPLVAAVCTRLLAWFFGSKKRVPFVVLGVGFLLLLATSGEILPYLWSCDALYASALDAPHWFTEIARLWFNLLLSWTTWWAVSPLGLLAGGIWLLVRQDWQNGPVYRVFTKAERARPSPWARIRGFFAARPSTALVAGAITIGVEIATGRPVRISLDAIRRHLLILGRSGRGKTETIVRVAHQCALGGLPIIFVDGKGDPEVRKALSAIAQRNGREFYCLDAMNPGDSCAYDHFANKSITTQKDMIVQLRDWSDDHFRGIASAHSQAVFRAMAYAGVEADLHVFSRSLSVKAMLGLAQRGAGRKGTYDKIKAEIIARRSTEKTAIESIASQVDSLTDSSFGELFDIRAARLSGRPILRLQEARERGAVVYCGLPALTFPDAATSFGSLLTADLKASLPASRKQWLIVFDEFSVFANPTTTLNLINMGRSWGASICLATQSCADFIATGSEAFLRQVFGSVCNFIVHELTDPTDADVIANLYSTTTTVEYTAQIVDHQRTGSASSRSVHEFQIHPEWIKRLGLGEAYVLNKDQPDDIAHTKIIRAEI